MKLIGYLSLGYPNLDYSAMIANVYLASGVDILEIDLPAANPHLESDYIKMRMKYALNSCSDYDKYLAMITQIKEKRPNCEIYLLAYEDTIKTIGIDKFCRFINQTGIKDVIYVGGNDLLIKNKLIRNNIKVASYLRFHLPIEDIANAKEANGFIYLQAKSKQINPKYPTLADVVKEVRSIFKDRIINCGVGVHSVSDVKMIKEAKADGVFVGKMFLELHDDVISLIRKIGEVRDEC